MNGKEADIQEIEDGSNPGYTGDRKSTTSVHPMPSPIPLPLDTEDSSESAPKAPSTPSGETETEHDEVPGPLVTPNVPLALLTSRLPGEIRIQAPGSITLPTFDLNTTTNGLMSSPLKRPPLPSAASPIIVEERPSSKMALYQAPEEVRPLVRQDIGQALTQDGDFAPTMDHYFQPLERVPLDAEENLADNGVHLDGRDIQMLIGSDGSDNAPELVDDELPEEEGALERQDALINAENVEEAAAPIPPPAEDVWEDEWTHLLEAVGMTGPWYCIVQNVGTALFLLKTY